MTGLGAALALAVALWVFVFRWHPIGFWGSMVLATAVLGAVGLAATRNDPVIWGTDRRLPTASDVAWGAGSAVALAAFFHAGGWLLRLMWPAAGSHIGAVYGLDPSVPLPVIALALLLVIGPGEELFWRLFLQQRMARQFGPLRGWASTTAIYGAVHVVTGNPVLVLAALVAGAFWGLMWWWRPRPWGVVISHALWDVLMFVVWPA